MVGNGAILIYIRVVKSGTSDGLYALLDTNNTGFCSTAAANYQCLALFPGLAGKITLQSLFSP